MVGEHSRIQAADELFPSQGHRTPQGYCTLWQYRHFSHHRPERRGAVSDSVVDKDHSEGYGQSEFTEDILCHTWGRHRQGLHPDIPAALPLPVREPFYSKTLELPVDWRSAFILQNLIGLREMPASEEGSSCKGRGVRCFQNKVSASVDERCLASGVITPEQENHSAAFI